MKTRKMKSEKMKEYSIMTAICERFEAIQKREGIEARDRLSLMLDLEAAHLEMPLKLAQLLHADEFIFVHDVAGIVAHMDRSTGRLKDFFVPRYTA